MSGTVQNTKIFIYGFQKKIDKQPKPVFFYIETEPLSMFATKKTLKYIKNPCSVPEPAPWQSSIKNLELM